MSEFELDVPEPFSSRPSGFYQSRPSIARFLEENAGSVVTSSGHELIRFDVLSEHQLYLSSEGTLAGIFVVTARPRPLDSTVTLELQLPWGESFDVIGEVRWVLDVPTHSLRQRPGMGVQVELTDVQRSLLERVLLLRAPIEVPPDVRTSGVRPAPR